MGQTGSVPVGQGVAVQVAVTVGVKVFEGEGVCVIPMTGACPQNIPAKTTIQIARVIVIPHR